MLIRLTPHHTTGGRWSGPGGHRGPAAFERPLELSQRAGEVRPGHGRHTTDWGVWSQPDKHVTRYGKRGPPSAAAPAGPGPDTVCAGYAQSLRLRPDAGAGIFLRGRDTRCAWWWGTLRRPSLSPTS